MIGLLLAAVLPVFVDLSLLSPEEVDYCSRFPFDQYEICQTEAGAFYLDDIGDGIKEDLKRGVLWEREVTEAIEFFTKPGTIAIDLGAYIGTHTLTLSKAVGPMGQVMAFEPQMKIYRELVMNISLNECENVSARHCAIGEKKQIVHLDPVIPGNEGARTIGEGEEKVQMFALDDFAFQNVSLIKIDVENYEEKILEGAKGTIRSNKPVLIVEILGHKAKALHQGIPIAEQTRTILHKLRAMGYSVEVLGCDYLCVPHGRQRWGNR